MSSDVIVIGLGAMGSAACYQLAKRGANVTGIDRYSPPHTLGSTHGETRVTRLAIGEGEQFVPFALRSHEIWRELEQETDAELLTITGGLIMSSAGRHNFHGNANFLQTTIDAAAKFGIKHRILGADDIAREFPQFQLSGNEVAYFENEAGFVRPEGCVATQLSLAEKLGARIKRNERVTLVEKDGDGVRVVTDSGSYAAPSAIISAGPWVHDFVRGAPAKLFKVYRQILYWFDVSAAYEQYTVGKFPIFIWAYGNGPVDFIYGFPAIDGREGGLKVAGEEFLGTTTPEDVARSVSADETARMFHSQILGKLRGVTEQCVRAAVCLYTSTADCNFVIDRLNENIILASPCSGHGFKHSAAVGETLAELALTGKSTIDTSPFRFATTGSGMDIA